FSKIERANHPFNYEQFVEAVRDGLFGPVATELLKKEIAAIENGNFNNNDDKCDELCQCELADSEQDSTPTTSSKQPHSSSHCHHEISFDPIQPCSHGH